MADAKLAFIAFCNANAEILAVFAHRITATRIPDNQAFPNARVLQVSSAPRYSHDKNMCGRKIRLQVDVYSDTPTTADLGMSTLETALSGYKGMMGTMNVGYSFVKTIDGDWNTTAREEHRMLELEIGTND
jgi:hypothetical protein